MRSPWRFLITMRCLLALLELGAIGQLLAATQADAQEFAVPESARAAIIDQTNAYRATKGLPPLRENQEASREAQAYAAYLAVTMRQGHSADGRSPFQRLRASGAKFCKFRGENWHEVPGRVRRAYCRRSRWMRPCGSGNTRRGTNARSAQPRPRSASASPAGATANNGTTRRSRCSSTPHASKARKPRSRLRLSPIEIRRALEPGRAMR